MIVSHCTGAVTCLVRMSLITAGSECAFASTFDTTGIRGFETSTVASTSESVPTAGAMKSVWKAPATASLTAIRAPKSGFAISITFSTASIAPETA